MAILVVQEILERNKSFEYNLRRLFVLADVSANLFLLFVLEYLTLSLTVSL